MARPSSTGDIRLSAHARVRLHEYNLTVADILYVLSDPDVEYANSSGREGSNWIRTLGDGRRIRVVGKMETISIVFVFTVVYENRGP